MCRRIVGIFIPVAFLFLHFQSGIQAQTLTPFQQKSIEEYVLQYGDILSAGELSLVDGFTADDAAWLWAEYGSVMMADATGKGECVITASMKKRYGNPGFSTTQKALYSRRGWESAITIDNDPCENYPDFLSGYVKTGGLAVGDFSARFGSGLVLWKGFSLSAFGEPSSLARQGGGISGYRSNDENNFFRGASYTHRRGNLEMTLLASYNGQDARVVDSVYTSLKTTGIHSSESERSYKNAMHEAVGGMNLTYNRGTWRIGLTAVCYRYDKHNGRRIQKYNELQIYDGLWGNAGVNFFGTAGSLRLFGEAALDAGGAPAVVAGLHWNPSYNFETSLVARAFSPAYIATHAADGSYNKIGGSFAMKYINEGWKFNLNAEYNYFPWYKYNSPAGESVFKGRMILSWTSGQGLNVFTQLGYSGRIKGRLHLSIPFGSVKVSTRLDATSGGYAFFVEPEVGFAKIRAAARMTWFDTDGWDSRIYLYEKGIPQSFGSTVYYGKGIGEYIVLKYSPNRYFNLWFKFQQDYCAFLIRIFIPG